MKTTIALLMVSAVLAGTAWAKSKTADAPAAAATAEVGKPAPKFTLTDAAGKTQSLEANAGKIVVLEWNNPDCPFVKKHYDSKNMQGLQTEFTGKGVVWLTVNSAAPGKQGHMDGKGALSVTLEKGAAPTAYLLDPDGKVGKMYGAKTTPHMFVIGKDGTLVYAGGIDDKPSADMADVKTAKNLVRTALEEVLAGKPVSTPTSQPYGCSVKYGTTS